MVQVTYDPQVIPYKELLEVFFTIDDPTTPNRQGHDVGKTSTVSTILTHNQEQQAVAQETIARIGAAGIGDVPIVTVVEPLTTFYTAEAYHQDYFSNNPQQPYCQVVVAPKVAKARKVFLGKLKR